MSEPLYAIASQYLEAFAMLEALELDEQSIANTLEGIEGELDEKIASVAAYIRNQEAELLGIEDKLKRVSERKRAMENSIERMKRYLVNEMYRVKKVKVATSELVVTTFMGPGRVVVPDVAMLPAHFIVREVSERPDKKALAEALKMGVIVPGASLERSVSLKIR